MRKETVDRALKSVDPESRNVPYIPKVIVKATLAEAAEMEEIQEEINVIQDTVRVAVDRGVELAKTAEEKKQAWAKKMSAKYGLGSDGNWMIDFATGEILR